MNVSLSDDPHWPRAGGWDEWSGDHADVVIVGIPAEATSLSSTSAAGTPAAIRDALRRYSHTYFLHNHQARSLDGWAVADAGDVASPDTENGRARAIAELRAIADKSGVVIGLGGDNSVTYPLALAVAGDSPATLGVITLDAHFDLRDGRSNGSPIRELIDAGVPGPQIAQVGIADFANSAHYAKTAAKLGLTVVPRSVVNESTVESTIARVLDVASAQGGPIHVDIDVDVCDRSVAPACPASLPGGLSAHELRRMVRLLAIDPRVKSFDITEIDHSQDTPDQRTIRLAALLVLEILAGVSLRRDGAR